MEVWVVDDHEMVCESVAEKIQRDALRLHNIELQALPFLSLGAVDKALKEKSAPKLLLLDINLRNESEGAETLERMARIRVESKKAFPVAVWTGEDFRTPKGAELLKTAVQKLSIIGVIEKDDSSKQMLRGLERMLLGEPWFAQDLLMRLALTPDPKDKGDALKKADLTAREISVLELIAQGKPNKLIAAELDLRVSYVSQITTKIYTKLGVTSRTQAGIKFLEAQSPED